MLAPEFKKPNNICAVCAEKSSSKCSNCKQVYYCSVTHQKEHWKKHKTVCHPFQVSSIKFLIYHQSLNIYYFYIMSVFILKLIMYESVQFEMGFFCA